MIDRKQYDDLKKLIAEYPAVALLGSRQIGKTTLAKMVAGDQQSLYLDLESTNDREKLSEPESYLSEHRDKLVILDEIHRVPELFQSLRGLIDKSRQEGKKAGQFLILGSASLDLLKQSSESLAGRISYLELFGLNVLEISSDKINDLWIRGGYPESYLAASEKSSMRWRNNFVKAYLERDIPQFGFRIPATTLERFWTMVAHNQGTLLNSSTFAKSLEVTVRTVNHYIDVLVDLLLLRKLRPWHANTGKRLVKSPKVYVRDSGLLHSLLGILNKEVLLGHPIIGLSWEGFVIENILACVPEFAQAYFYKTAAGAEIDLVLVMPDKQIWAIEIKRTVPKLSKGFLNGCEDIGAHKAYIVYSGDERYAKNDNVDAIGLVEICQKLEKLK